MKKVSNILSKYRKSTNTILMWWQFKTAVSTNWCSFISQRWGVQKSALNQAWQTLHLHIMPGSSIHTTDSSCVSFLGHVATSMSYLKYARTVHQRYNSRKPCCSARGKRGESTNHPECGLPSIVSKWCKCNTDSIECLPSTYEPVILQFRGNIASKKRCLACTTSSLLGRCLSRTVHWTKRP